MSGGGKIHLKRRGHWYTLRTGYGRRRRWQRRARRY